MTPPAPARTGRHPMVVVANRLPVEQVVDDAGATTWAPSPGGLVTAMTPVLRSQDAVWIGWAGRARDDDNAQAPLPEATDTCALGEVSLSREELERFYEGFCNSTIWPLYHDAVVTPVYHRHLWETYVAVNQRFADAAAAAAAPGATVWVHDYQLQLVPRMLREQRPDLRIGFFLHIPFPPVELFMQLPWRYQILDGLLGADLVGFHTRGGAANLLALTDRLMHLDPDADGVVVPTVDGAGRRVEVGAFPISIATPEFDALARTPSVQARAAEIRSAVGDPAVVLLGVDRLDYTKGIDVRLTAFSELLDDGSADDWVLIQVATPSRGNVEEYQRLRDGIEQRVGRINGDHAQIGRPPVQYLHQGITRDELVAYYVAADVMLVTPYRDGMNLVAKEYVASRIHDDGALVLSEMTGAAIELTTAFLVNPYDADGIKAAILAAVHADDEELYRRMAPMRARVTAYDVDRWAADFLGSLRGTPA